ncbi:hypothetical protein R1sor_003202 [Riccia sorocarpa]|uniref:F-box domain-containing protein n=1 Tax=Riccia sorocarpa TaxID=122646 RepID=A0ABD3H4C3_9MARC
MDPKIWEKLTYHEDILRLIFSRVSWDTNLRLRSVSKGFCATLPEPSVFTWSSMLSDTSFYTNHSNLEWVDGGVHHLGQSHADALCLFRTDTVFDFGISAPQPVPYVVLNFELHRWCKLPQLGDLPFGDLNDFRVTGVAEGLLLLEKRIPNDKLEKGTPFEGLSANIYELDRFIFNPLTKGFTKLPVVPKVKDPSALIWNGLRSEMIMAVEEELVTVVATEFSSNRRGCPTLTRILIWHKGSEDWEPLETYDLTCTFITSVDSAVFVGGELFLHTLGDMDDYGLPSRGRVFICGSRATDPELIFICEEGLSNNPLLHLFQYKGSLKRLELTVATGGFCHIKLGTFDRLSRSWQEEDIEMSTQMQLSLYVTLVDICEYISSFMDVSGDILCIGNQCKPDVFFLYNFLSKQWCECSAKEPLNQLLYNSKIFLWSPKWYDSWIPRDMRFSGVGINHGGFTLLEIIIS